MRLAFEGVRLGLAAIWGNKLRSSLTLLANVIAVSSVIAVVSIIAGMDAYLRDKLAAEGASVFSVERSDGLLALSSMEEYLASRRNPRITLDDMRALARGVTSADAVGAQVSAGSPFTAGRNEIESARVRGVAGEYAELVTWQIDDGRHLAPPELRRSAPVAVIGQEVAEKLFEGSGAVGRYLRIHGRPFRIVGVAERRGSVFGQSQDLFALIPMGIFHKLFGARQSVEVKIRADDPERLELARDEATVVMRTRHRLRPAEEDDFALTSSQALADLIRSASSQLAVGVVAIAAISLVVGGIVIMNIMLVSVTERTREIGLRKALGARHSSILWQFLVEAVTFSMTGGAIGVVLGFTIAAVVATVSPLPYAVQSMAVVAALLVTAVVGMVFGLYPASRAARLDPIEALHWE